MAKMSVRLMNTGCFYADGGCMFGATPQSAWKRRYKADELNRCVLAMQVGVVTTASGEVVLIDSGVGSKHLEKLEKSFYRFHKTVDLPLALRQRGIRPEQVTDVILTHLHFDHCGGVVRYNCEGKPVPVFPNATCWVSEAQWNEASSPNALERDSFLTENTEAVRDAGLLRLINEETFLSPHIRLRLVDGHTRGQIVADVQTESFTVVFAGDVIPTAAHVSPTWISAYDISPLDAYHEKIRLLDEAVENNQVVVYCHDVYTPCSTIKRINDFYKIDRKMSL